MTRVIFAKGQLDQYLSLCKTKKGMSLPQLAQIIMVNRHTLNDWRREKLLPNLEKLKILSESTNTPLPPIIKTKLDTWGSVKAGHIKQNKYGCTLSIEDRVKGGHNSQVVRKENPEYYRMLGCNVRNKFTFPNHNIQFAELVGLLLGDGHIDKNGQFTVTLNSIADKEYSKYVIKLINLLFNYTPSISKKKNCNALTITLTGKDVIEFLILSGMKLGDKVKQQVDVPDWIKSDPKLSRWCLRGLMDTDGGIFTNPYIINGKSYVYPKTNFTNASQPLLDFVYKVLLDNGFHPNNKVPRKVWLYSKIESRRYLEIIGSSNERLLKKIR